MDAKRLASRLEAIAPAEVATTIISYEEQTRGWMAYLGRAKTIPQQVEAYRRLAKNLTDYKKTLVVEFDINAAMVFQRLRRAYPRLGTMDLKIAAIALSLDGTLLSRNLCDFKQISGLRVEDWAV